ncbi:MAG: START-like domain-containing protein [Saprospiraceae bacterium]
MKRVKIDMEFIFRASPAIIYKFLTQNECLVRWFCDGADVTNDMYVFDWQGSEEEAELVDDLEEERVRYIFVDNDPGEYMEFRLYKSDVTNETILEVTDFCDKGEENEQKALWDTQIANLKIETGG